MQDGYPIFMPTPSQLPAASSSVPVNLPSQNRLVSLDVFRGLTMACMILVNNPGSDPTYAQLEHSSWNGWTFTDTVFPFFLWIVGVAITLATARRVEQGADRRKLFLNVCRRAILLFALGLFLNALPYFHLTHLRYLGVIQRIAICYFCAATLFIFTKWRTQVVAILLLFGTYWLFMTQYPVPGVGKGHLGQDANFERYLDNIVLAGHIWSGSKYWDPEGTISTLPAICTALFGVLTGQLLRAAYPMKHKLSLLLRLGLALVALGLLVNYWMPINKNLWSVSFSCFMAGLATIEFLLLYWILDVKKWRSWSKPFIIYGMNAIAVYVMADLLAISLGVITVKDTGGDSVGLGGYLYAHIFAPLASQKNASLLFAIAFVSTLFAGAAFLYRRRWFLKI